MKVAVRFSLQRFLAIDQAVRAGQFPNATTLGRELEVSPRTIQRDIEFLRDRLEAPLAFDPRRNGYFYTDPGYRYAPMMMTEGEMISVLLAERVLQTYRGTPYAADLARVFRKITAALPDQITIDLGHLGETHSFRTPAATEVAADTFAGLSAAIRQRQRLTLRYYSASRDAETSREVDPYHLSSVAGQWYLVAFCHLRGEERLFVPTRIRSFEPTGVSFDPPTDFRIDDYLAPSFAVMRGSVGERYEVRLRFVGEAVKYVRERIWHPSQCMEETPDGGLILGFEVSHLREVERFALSWGPDCVVLAPPELRDRVTQGLLDASRQYTADPNRSSPPDVSTIPQDRSPRTQESSCR